MSMAQAGVSPIGSSSGRSAKAASAMQAKTMQNLSRSLFYTGVRLQPVTRRQAAVVPRSAQTQAVLEANVTGLDAQAANTGYTPMLKALSGSAVLDVPQLKPAEVEREKFKLHWSVDFWRDLNTDVLDETADGRTQLRNLLQAAQRGLSEGEVLSSPQSAAYWTYHIGRSSFFVTQGLAVLLGSRSSSAVSGNSQSSTGFKLENLFKGGLLRPLVEALAMYRQDYMNIKEGLYKLPWDMTSPTHRQFNPLYVLAAGQRFLAEAADTMTRRTRGTPDNLWLTSTMYPDYYMNTFHYQSDGWMSAKSASIYETSTETLFVGRQDAMQRQTLVPVGHFMRGRMAAGMKALDVGAGTGRFATFLKDNYNKMEVTCLDLSPYYLARARENISYWKRLRAADEDLGGPEGTGAAFMQAAAEDIPADNNTYDVVTSIYLFHELPAEVRRRAAAEMARVLKPGGLLVLTDSVQFGDRRPWDAVLGNFGNFNEPYYRTYISTDLGALFEDAGLECDTKILSSSSKTLSFRKPLTTPPPGAPAKPVNGVAHPQPSLNGQSH